MRATNKQTKRTKNRAITVGGMSRDLLQRLREDAKENHRSLAGHVRALLENALGSAETAQ